MTSSLGCCQAEVAPVGTNGFMVDESSSDARPGSFILPKETVLCLAVFEKNEYCHLDDV